MINNKITKTYYINLDRRVDRNLHMLEEKEKSKYLFSAERYRAIDGKMLDINTLDSKFITKQGIEKILSNKVNNWGTDLTYGSVGCALSHYNLYIDCFNNSYTSIMILEDDIRLSNNIDTAIDVATNFDFDTFDIFYFGYHNNPKKFPIDDHVYFAQSYVYGCFGYIISLRGIKKILMQSIKFYQIDFIDKR